METLHTDAVGIEKTTNWVLDPLHSEIQFKIKHLVISTVTGSFGQFTASLTSPGADFENASVEATIDVNSIHTGQPDRDTHLKGSDFFNTEQFPTIHFQSTAFRKKTDSTYALEGNLTLKGITQPVVLDVEYGGIQKDPRGNIKVGFDVTGIIHRKEFGLAYNAVLEAGGLALGEQVKLAASVQFARQ